MLKLKLQYFGHLMGRTDSFEKTPMLGNIEGGRRRGRQRMRWLDGIKFEWTLGVGDGEGSLVCCSPWGHKESDTTKRPNWTEALEMRRLIEIFAKTSFQSWIQNLHNNMLLKHWKIRCTCEKEHKAAHFKNADHRENYLSKRQWVLCPWEAAMKLPTLQKLF